MVNLNIKQSFKYNEHKIITTMNFCDTQNNKTFILGYEQGINHFRNV